MRREETKKMTPVVLAYLILGCGFLAQIISLIFSKGEFLGNIVYDFSRFTDFFDHIRRFYLGLDSVYQEGEGSQISSPSFLQGS